MSSPLREFLKSKGMDDAAIDRAAANRSIVLRTAELVLMGSDADRYRVEEIVDQADIDRPTAESLWRSLGFPVDGDEGRYSEIDLLALVSAKEFFDLPAELPLLLDQSRVMASAMSRIGETMSDRIISEVDEMQMSGAECEEIADELYERLAVDQFMQVVEYMFRRQMLAVLERRLDQTVSDDETDILTAVGFADLAGFTRLSHRVGQGELSAIVDRFESRSFDLVAQHGGRIVKTIGDEVMFVAEDPTVATNIALHLIEDTVDDELLPELRIGLAYGHLIARRGDYFGDAVNRASRLTGHARRGTVLVDTDTKEAVGDEGPFDWRSLGKVRLKDLGRIRVWTARRLVEDDSPSGQPTEDSDARTTEMSRSS